MALECPHCGKKYRVTPEQLAKLPPAIRCKACQGVIEIPKQAEASPASPESGESGEEIRILVCSDCGKRYRVPTAKLPAGRDHVPCKACGGTVPLAEAEASPPADPFGDEPDDADNDAGSGDDVDRSVDEPDEETPIYRKVWFMAACAAALLVVLGIAAKPYLFPEDTYVPPPRDYADVTPSEAQDDRMDEPQLEPEHSEGPLPVADVVASSTPTEAHAPFLAISVNVPLILETVTQVLQDPNQPNMELAMATGMIQGMGLGKAHVFMTFRDDGVFLPSISVEMTNPLLLEQMILSKQGPAEFLIAVEPGVYAYDMSLYPESLESAIPLAEYRLYIRNGWVVVGPKHSVRLLVDRPDTIAAYGVTQFAAALGTETDLLSVSGHVTPDLYANWEARFQHVIEKNSPPGTPNPVTAEIADRINQAIATLEMIERFGLAVNISDQGQRVVRYRQQFAAGVDGTDIYDTLNQGHFPSDGSNDMMSTMLSQSLLRNPLLKRTVDFEANQLTVQLDWAQAQDEALVDAVMMMVMTLRSMGGDMGVFPVPADGASGL